MKILITDDEIEIRRVLRMLLESHGHNVAEAKDGEEAVMTLTNDNSFDLCIMDIMMPKLSGISRHIKHDFKSFIACAIRLERYSVHHYSMVPLGDEGVFVNLKVL